MQILQKIGELKEKSREIHSVNIQSMTIIKTINKRKKYRNVYITILEFFKM